MIDLARAATPRVGPVLETLLTDAAEDGIEISLGNQESVVLWLDRFIGGREIERRSVVEFDHLEGTANRTGADSPSISARKRADFARSDE